MLEYLAGGMSEDEILTDFPSLTREHIRAVLAYAAERERAVGVILVPTRHALPLRTPGVI